MRVIFAGQTGVEKRIVLENLARFAAKRHGLPANLNHCETRKFIQVKIAEDGIREKHHGHFDVFLEKEHRGQRQSNWREVFQNTLEQIEDDPPTHILVGVHAAFLRRGQYFSCIDADLLRKLGPTVFVTLIDDVYDIWQRIEYREERQKTESSFELQELLTWRSVEIMLADVLKHTVKKRELRHFVVAVKHPTEMLYRLLFERDRLIVYGGCPITTTRSTANGRDEIDRFRKRLRPHFTLFDPLTIDELRIDVDGKKLTDRWPAGVRWPLVRETAVKTDPVSKLRRKRDREALMETIGRQIRRRDFRLVDDSDALAGYRPHYGADPKASMGLHREMIHADTRIHVYHPPKDKAKGGVVPFHEIESAIKHSTIKAMIDALHRDQEQKKARHNQKGLPLTWE